MPRVEGFEDSELEGLSKEEIEALGGEIEGENEPVTADDLAEEEADKATAEKAAADKAEQEKADTEASNKAEESGAKETEVSAEDKAAAELKEKAATDAAAAIEAEKQQQPSPKPEIPAFLPPIPDPVLIPEDKIKAMQAAADEAQQKFDAGEITYEKFQEARRDLDKATLKNELALEQYQKTRESYWQWEQARFFSQNASFQSNRALNSAFAAEVNRILASPEGDKMSDADVLNKAKEAVEKDLGFLPKKKEEESKPDAEAVRKKALESHADRTQIPKSLGGLPSAETETAVGKWDYLERLDGAAFEKAVARLSPAEREEYEESH